MTGKCQYAPWSGGLMSTLSWKGIQLDVQFTGMFDRYMTNNMRYFVENAGFASDMNQTTDMLNMWTTPGQVTDIPAADADIEFDTHLLEEASFAAFLPGFCALALQGMLWCAVAVMASAFFSNSAVAALATATVLSDVNWAAVGSAALLAGILSLCTSIATGLPEVDGHE